MNQVKKVYHDLNFKLSKWKINSDLYVKDTDTHQTILNGLICTANH